MMQAAPMCLSARPFARCSVQARRGPALRALAPLPRRACRRRVVTQARRHQEQQGVDPNATAGSPNAPQEGRGPLSNLPLIAVSVALVWGLTQTAGIWKNVTKKEKKDAAVAGRAAIIESMSDQRVADLFRRVDTNSDGRVDLRELTDALGKLNPSAPLSAARDSALDVFLLFDKDRHDRTLNKEEFGQFLETWCLQTETSLDEIISRVGEPRDVEEGSPEDQRVEQEVSRAAEAPEDLSRVLERRKLEAVFRLWADRRGAGGRVERKELCKALTRLLDNSGSQDAERARGLVTSPSGSNQHAGYQAHLNRTEFSDLVRRVSDVGGLKQADVLDFLIVIPLYGEERNALPPGRAGEGESAGGQGESAGGQGASAGGTPTRASALSDLAKAKEAAGEAVQRKKAINILAEARKEAADIVEQRKREEAERERRLEQREGQGKAGGQASGGAGNGAGGGGGTGFRGSTASEAGIESAASDQGKGSSTARS